MRRLAADLGVPDFVFRPSHAPRGTARREVGDGLLVVGQRGVIIQVKSREQEVGLADDADRAALWIRKHAAKALRQVKGTRRSLRTGGQFTSMRGYPRTLSANTDWPAVVIIDHPLDVPLDLGDEPGVVWLTLTDWLNLHDRLRSTRAVIDYVELALASGHSCLLGRERDRYARLAAAQLDAGRGTDPARLPLQRLSGADSLAVDLFDDLVERAADPTNDPWDTVSYLDIVEMLDAQPVLARASAGRKLWATLTAVRRDGRQRGFLFLDAATRDRFVVLYGRAHATMTDHHLDHAADISAYTAVRHAEALEGGAPVQTRTLGIGIRHHDDLGRQYGFVLLAGEPIPMDTDLRRSIEARHGVYDPQRHRTHALAVGRNDRCPCGSGLKTKRCHPRFVG